ncbi:unnamed protein product, partial [Scytosiphon promiscuus]
LKCFLPCSGGSAISGLAWIKTPNKNVGDICSTRLLRLFVLDYDSEFCSATVPHLKVVFSPMCNFEISCCKTICKGMIGMAEHSGTIDMHLPLPCQAVCGVGCGAED